MAFIKTRLACDNCGSSDARGEDDNGWSYCFGCKHNYKLDNAGSVGSATQYVAPKPLEPSVGVFTAIADRNISADTCRTYQCATDGNKIVFNYFSAAGEKVAEKVRSPDKQFSITGQWKESALYGQHLFKRGGKYVTLCEGELDALAAYQMTGSKWPVVSIRNGAASALKDCKEQFEWLDSFDNIVVCFDNDTAGKEAAAEVAELFGGKSRVMKHRPSINSLPIKDACDYLRHGLLKDFSDGWWGAEKYVPDGIIQGSDLFDAVMAPIEASDVDYPYDGLNKLTYGIRKGELVTITAGSGLGKSQFVREIVWHVLQNTSTNIGLMFLEEGTRKTGLSIMSLAANQPLHLPDSIAGDDVKLEAYEKTLGTGRLYLFDHFGSTSVDNIINRVRYLAKGLGCEYIFLDHISIVVSAQASGDERKAIDEIMTRLRMIVQETGVSLVCVSHLKRAEGKGHEDGAATSLSQLRGSGSIAQLSDMVISLERDGQNDDSTVRNTTTVRVLKNRFCGITGKACHLLYSLATGRMREFTPEEQL
jgi:twinkle protein